MEKVLVVQSLNSDSQHNLLTSCRPLRYEPSHRHEPLTFNEPNVLQRKIKVYIVCSPTKSFEGEHPERGSEKVELRALAPGFLKDL